MQTDEERRFAKLLELADDHENFYWCGPSDDPDEQTATIAAYHRLVVKLTALAKRIKNPAVQDALKQVNPRGLECLVDCYETSSYVEPLIDELRHLASHPQECAWEIEPDVIIESQKIDELRDAAAGRFDLSKIARLCEEMNDAYARANYVSCVLLLRAIMNHVPPLWGESVDSFKQVVAQSPKSTKDLLAPLEEIARKIADHHTHALIRTKESLPTRAQIEPFRPNIEHLLNEVLYKASQLSAA